MFLSSRVARGLAHLRSFHRLLAEVGGLGSHRPYGYVEFMTADPDAILPAALLFEADGLRWLRKWRGWCDEHHILTLRLKH